jgi:hypothetical protein
MSKDPRLQYKLSAPVENKQFQSSSKPSTNNIRIKEYTFPLPIHLIKPKITEKSLRFPDSECTRIANTLKFIDTFNPFWKVVHEFPGFRVKSGGVHKIFVDDFYDVLMQSLSATPYYNSPPIGSYRLQLRCYSELRGDIAIAYEFGLTVDGVPCICDLQTSMSYKYSVRSESDSLKLFLPPYLDITPCLQYCDKGNPLEIVCLCPVMAEDAIIVPLIGFFFF